MILPRARSRPTNSNRRTSKYNEKADDVDAWPVARTGRSFGFLRGRCPGPDQEEEEGQEVRHNRPQSGCPLIGLDNDFRRRAVSCSREGLRGVVIFAFPLDSLPPFFLISSWMQGLASSLNEHFRER